MLQSLNTEEKCREYLEELRWHGEPICPHCGSISKHHYKLTQNGEFKGLYKCKDCRKRFTISKIYQRNSENSMVYVTTYS